jgi:cytochrome c oxidase subunit I+III
METLHQRLEAIWRTPPGLASLSGVNHTTVGLRLVVSGFIFFLVGGVLAMLIRSQLAFPENRLLDHQEYNAAFTLHGTAMMFFFAVPIMLGFAAYFVPKMIGARDLIYPRLSAYGYWCYLFGGLLLFSSVLVGQPPTAGWFMYVPLSNQPYSPDLGPDFWLLGITFAEISAVATSIELIVSILKTRAPGMSLERMPIYVWAMLVTAFMILFAFPPLILGGILLEIERAFGLPFFTPARGGDPLLWQHLFWLFGHPEVYLIFLPAAGIVSAIVPTFARLPLAGYKWVVLALVGTGFLSFGLWVHHMYTTGIPLVALSFFSAASMAVAIPAGIQVFAWIATLWNGKPVMSAPLLFVMGFFAVFVLGGLTGVMLALVPFDWQAHDTQFVVAHLHYVLFGGMVFPLFAGLYYWLPLISGRAVSQAGSKVVFWLIFIGFNLTFLPMHLTGLVGMPRRVYTYADGLGWEALNLVSTIGGFVTAVGVGAFLVDFALNFRFGRPTTRNPWKAATLEWALPTPVPSYNFASQPAVGDRDPLWSDSDLVSRMESGGFYLGHGNPTRREMLMTSALKAEPEQVVILPGNTWVPLVAAVFTGLFFVGVLVKAYGFALLGLALSIVVFIVWVWRGGKYWGAGEMNVGRGKRLPLHFTQVRGPGWWGTVFALMADGALFGSLVFAFLFLWTVSPAWPPSAMQSLDWRWPAFALVVLASSSLAVHRRRYGLGIALAIAFVAVQSVSLFTRGLDATEHAYDALVFTIYVFAAVHVATAMLMAAVMMFRGYSRDSVPRHRGEPAVTALFWHYSVLQWVVGYAVIYLPPLIVSP